ncbi:MAG: hypothetical protein PHU31_06565 [Anaerotignum sp.]|nr:hypothetical protein [Anaerotignum sp.]
MKLQNNNLDEMQEQKLLKIEHNGCWLAFWGLLAAILVQTILLDANTMGSIAGEWIVFMCLALYLCVSCIKNGIWDRKLKPNGKTNIIVSFISSFLCSMIFFVSSYVKYHSILGSIATGVFIFISVFVLTILTLSLSMKLYQKRISKIETDCEE